MPFRHRFVEATPLARGAEGRLFRVRDEWTGRWGALKVASDRNARASILAEFRLLSRLRHPCILESQEVLEEGEVFGHLLEYLPAVDPFSLWDAGGEAAIWAATVQSLRGLTYLHRQGFVHADVAPGNILVWREGDGWRAKLADFGLALPLDEAARAGLRGTRGYWAPETATENGTFPGSDLYALAATMHAWIDGRGPWDDLSPTEQLRAMAKHPDLPKPRRRVSPELESLYATLGASHIEARRNWDWDELRSRTASWGPATMVATLSGLEPFASEWARWLGDLPGGQAAALVLTGRVGSGRRTALGFFMRELAAEGWMSNWTSPLGMLHDRFAASGQDLDPVLAARELVHRTEARHLVFRWPEQVSDLESRILRAFIAAREDASSDRKTLVVHASGVETSDDVLEWLRGATRVRVDDWKGPGEAALRTMAADLFALEEGLKREAVETAQSPLALVRMKQGDVQGIAEITSEMGRLWARITPLGRALLSLLADSDQGWAPDDMAGAMNGSEDEVRTQLNELGRLGLIRRSFEAGMELESIADALTREAVLGHAEHGYALAAVGEALQRGSHPEDLGLARRLFENGHAEPRYTVVALERALREGRYEQVLDFSEKASHETEAFGEWRNEVWSLFLRAARRAGKYETQVRLLRDLIQGAIRPGDSPPSREGEAEAVIHRKALAQALTNLGDWKQAVEECHAIEASTEAGEKDQLWAKLQRAETLWQAGRFADADATYAEVERSLSDSMAEEWLRFAVGRARQHGQRGDMAGVKTYLELAEQKAGKDICEKNAMYLNTLGGWLIEKSELDSARPVLQQAAKTATEEGNWAAYVMIASREASLTYDYGDMKTAAKIGREGVATAEALLSDRILSFTNSFLAYPETHLGNVGSAWRRSKRVLDLAQNLGDKNIEVLAFRLRAFIASAVGWRDLTDRSASKVEEIAESIGEDEAISFAALCRGLFHFGAEEWDEAERFLSKARQDFAKSGQPTSELKARIYLSLLQLQRGNKSAAAHELSGIHEISTSQKVTLLEPVARLASLLVNTSTEHPVSGEVIRILSDFESRGRYLDLIEWGCLGLSLGNGARKQVRTHMLNAVQRIAESLDDVQLRREFLGFPRTKKALLALQR